MKFVLPFTGSRGDVQPGLALAIELDRRGHRVTFGAPPNLVTFATAATTSSPGVTVVPFGPDTKALLESDLVRRRIKAKNPRTRIAALAELANFGWDDMTSQLATMASGADAAVTGTLGQEMTFNVAESLAIPFLALHYCPIRSNGSMSVVPGKKLPPIVNRATWRVLETMRWRSMRDRENKQRRSLGLPDAVSALPNRIARYGGSELQAYDGALFPGVEQEWGPLRPFVGFIELPSTAGHLGAELGQGSALRDWIDEDSPPLYFGFGSMPVKDPESLVRIIEEVCAAGGHRAVISSGWSSMSERIESGAAVALVSAVDHAALFPLCRAAIHHGGAGTTAASIRAGLPTMICWFSADQPFWGAALGRVGAGTSVKFSSLDNRTLQHGLEILLAPDTAARARELASSMTPPTEAVRRSADLVESAVTRNDR